MRRIILVRHGETEWNADGNRYCGRTDLPLSEIGREQAATFSRDLGTMRERIDIVLHSGLRRSRETAEAIAFSASALRMDARLAEVDFGEWEGLRPAEIATRWPVEFSKYKSDPAGSPIPGGGKLEACGLAVALALRERSGQSEPDSPQIVLAVGHTTSLRAGIATLLGLPLSLVPRLHMENCRAAILSERDGAWRLDALNLPASHLQDYFP